MEKDNKKLEELMESLAVSIAKGFEKVGNDLHSFKLETNTHFNNLESDLKSFKIETRERFDVVDKRLNEIDENISGIVEDYHPHIVALEEKVFGSSTLAEA